MSESIGQFYSNFIKEKFIKEKIKLGQIPATELVDAHMSSMAREYNNFSTPMISNKDHFIEIEEKSSAKKMNKICEDLFSDLSVGIKSLEGQGKKITNIFDATSARLAGMASKINKLKTKAENLLFESKNSDRHEELFYERFLSLDMVDTELTTADIDLLSNSVSLKHSSTNVVSIPNDKSNIEAVPQSSAAIVSSSSIQGMDIVNILNSTGKTWGYQIKTNDAVSQIYVDIVIRIPSLKTQVNKIIIDPAMMDIKTQANIDISYSGDKLNWRTPDGENRKRILGKTSFDFAATNAEYWRLRITKYGNDGFFDGSYVYNFGLKSILFIGKDYQKLNRNDNSYFYSKIVSPQKDINAINIRVCESKPAFTSIKYGIAPVTEDQMVQLNNKTVSPKDLCYYPVDLVDKDSYTLDLLALSSQSVSSAIKATSSINYEDRGEFDFCLDSVVSSKADKNGLLLMRGLGNNESSDNYGWTFNGLYYSTYVLVENIDGVDINLGDTRMILNGNSVSGLITIPSGMNHIASPKEYWAKIDLSSLPQNGKTPDPLYPYNHKYLIEGLGTSLYGVSLDTDLSGTELIDVIDPEKCYRVFKKIWQHKAREISFGEFEQQAETTLDVFSFKLDNSDVERIVVKSSNDLMASEDFSLILKIQDSTPIKGLIFKAELLTDDVKSTPVLTEYLLKFR